MVESMRKKGPLKYEVGEGFCPHHGHFEMISINGSSIACPDCVLANQRSFDDNENRTNLDNSGLISFFSGGKVQREIPLRFADATFQSYIPSVPAQESIRDQMMAFADDYKRSGKGDRNIIMTGHMGTGKTHLAISLGKRMAENGFRAAYLTIFDLMRSDRSRMDQNLSLIDQLNTYDMVILDEVGAHPDFGFSAELMMATLFQLIDSRYMRCLSTVLVTNINLTALETGKSGIGDRAMDRMADAIMLKFFWDSER